MNESGQDHRALMPRQPLVPQRQTTENANLPIPTIDWKEVMYNTSSNDVTALALKTVRGKVRVPGASLPGLTIETARSTSPVKRYGMYAIEAASLYYENRDGKIDDQAARKRAEEIVRFYDEAQQHGKLDDADLREELDRMRVEVPKDLDEILRDPTKLLERYK